MTRLTWAVLLAVPALAWAQVSTPESRARCAIRISAALQAKTATAAQQTAADPQAGVDALIATPDFQERFARFVNSQFNGDPGQSDQRTCRRDRVGACCVRGAFNGFSL